MPIATRYYIILTFLKILFIHNLMSFTKSYFYLQYEVLECHQNIIIYEKEIQKIGNNERGHKNESPYIYSS